MSVFADDSDISAKRETALRAILDSLPAAYRIPMGGQFRAMVDAMNEQQLTQCVDDIREGKAAAQRGDMDALINLARHWATDEQIKQYLPVAQNMLKAG